MPGIRKILINDANILIDLVKLELIKAFSELDFDLHTTDFVMEELNDTQREPITELKKTWNYRNEKHRRF